MQERNSESTGQSIRQIKSLSSYHAVRGMHRRTDRREESESVSNGRKEKKERMNDRKNRGFHSRSLKTRRRIARRAEKTENGNEVLSRDRVDGREARIRKEKKGRENASSCPSQKDDFCVS